MSTPPTVPVIRVLLVDDEPGIRRALRSTLSELGFSATEASRGEEALHLVQKETFDVVLLDINMPGIGGMKTLLRLRALAPRLPILMLTVRDDGVGFDARFTHKLFNAFNRLHGDKEFRGSGIGLATVARIIRRHQGRIWAESVEGHGATFWFQLA